MMQRDETKVVVIARFLAKEGKAQELLAEMHKLMEPTHNEPGNLRYELNQNSDNPHMITYIEKFRNQEGFDTHKNSSYIAAFFKDVAPRLVEQQDITFHREVLPDRSRAVES